MLLDHLCTESSLNFIFDFVFVLELKNKNVLALFSCYLEANSYTFSIRCSASHSSIDALQKIILSSVKNR